MISNPRHVFLTTLVILLSSCGGGGGGSGKNVAASSSIGQVTPQFIDIAPDNQNYRLDEDQELIDQISLNFNLESVSGYIDVVGANGEKAYTIATRQGGVVKLLYDDALSQRIRFNYHPSEDFNGDDDCDIYLRKNGYESTSGATRQKIVLHFHVNPVADDKLKFTVRNKKVFVAGDNVQLSLPNDADTKISLPSTLNFKLFVDSVPVNYSIDAEGINFLMPIVPAGVNRVNIQFDYQEEFFNLAQTLTSKIDYGDVEYWLGDKSRPGVTYVLMTEQRVDQQIYLNWVNTEFRKLLDEPLILRYGAYWNLAVIKQPAPGNYASKDSSTEAVIGNLGESGEAFIKRFVPNYDWVILNTNIEGRATGGYPMVINQSPIDVILHEFGHVHARLADEYADSGAGNPEYYEDFNPNVTNFNNYDSIPWKHWIVDRNNIPGVNAGADANGVGAFLGAYYSLNRFYRPMDSSKMRNVDAPFSPVDSEAWVLGTYERLGVLASITSTKGANVRTLNVARQWDKNLTQIDWFLNNVKQEQWINQSTITIDENTLATNSYSVRAELTDLSGYVKNPHAYSAFKRIGHADMSLYDLKNAKNESFEKVWTFEKSTATAAAKLQKQELQVNSQASANGDNWISHQIIIKNGEHQLAASTPYDQPDTLVPVTLHSELRADVADVNGNIVYSIGVDRPYLYLHDSIGSVMLKDKGSYKIKHPYIDGNYQIFIVDQRTKQLLLKLDFPQKKQSSFNSAGLKTQLFNRIDTFERAQIR